GVPDLHIGCRTIPFAGEGAVPSCPCGDGTCGHMLTQADRYDRTVLRPGRCVRGGDAHAGRKAISAARLERYALRFRGVDPCPCDKDVCGIAERGVGLCAQHRNVTRAVTPGEAGI